MESPIEIPVRTGGRALAFGDPASRSGTLELRFIDANVDMVAGDLLTTSGVDGVYPPGLPVARVLKIERRADSAFARISCAPVAGVTGSLQAMEAIKLLAGIPSEAVGRLQLLDGKSGEWRRMRLVRDDIDARVLALLDELVPDSD